MWGFHLQKCCTLGVILGFLAALHVNAEDKKPEQGKPRVLNNLNGDLNIPSDMPTEHQKLIQDKYAEFMKQRADEKKKSQKQEYPKPPEGMSPRKEGLVRRETSSVPLTKQVKIPGGGFWFGTQLDIEGKVVPANSRDGAAPRRPAKVAPFYIDTDCVTNEQFRDFIVSTGYKTEAELFGWSFVLDSLASEDVINEVDGEFGYGRVKDAPHWCAVKSATWMTPLGNDSSIDEYLQYPAVHISFKDAEEYCAWAGNRRLPTELEWEFAARGGLYNVTYPWGDEYKPNRMNVWDGEFPKENTLRDGFHGVAPVKTYAPQNAYGLYNMLGNVWEWVASESSGGKKKRSRAPDQLQPGEAVLRGGSFVDSLDGSFNHIVIVSTKQVNAADSAANNIGFRCASTTPTSDKSEL